MLPLKKMAKEILKLVYLSASLCPLDIDSKNKNMAVGC